VNLATLPALVGAPPASVDPRDALPKALLGLLMTALMLAGLLLILSGVFQPTPY
jgi:hypothetical protein